MMKKKEVYTNVTPLPSFIPRQLAVDILHSHSEIITLNPLVTDHRPISAPRDAPAEEYYSTWYEISERIQVVPGAGRLGGSKISFRGCFHDVPWGVQTHIYAPMGIDLRHNYRVAGSQPSEPAEHRELGLNAPSTGLYLREDIEIRCNFTMVSFVRNQLKAASKILVDRLIKKAELLDAGVLQAMMENGRLKTINHADRSTQKAHLPSLSNVQRPSTSGSHPDESQPAYLYANNNLNRSPSDRKSFVPPVSPGKNFATELPGDTYYYHQQPTLSPPPTNPNSYRDSIVSTSSHPSTGGWSYASSMSSTTTTNYNSPPNTYPDGNVSRPMSTTSTIAPFVLVDGNHNNHNNNNNNGYYGVSGKHHFAAELPAMEETREEK